MLATTTIEIFGAVQSWPQAVVASVLLVCVAAVVVAWLRS